MLSDAVWPVRVRVRVGVSSLNGVIMGLLIVHYKFILNRTDGAIFLIVFNNESRHARWILAEAERWEDSTAPDTVSSQLGSVALCTELKWCNVESRHFELEINIWQSFSPIEIQEAGITVKSRWMFLSPDLTIGHTRPQTESSADSGAQMDTRMTPPRNNTGWWYLEIIRNTSQSFLFLVHFHFSSLSCPSLVFVLIFYFIIIL